MHVMINKITSEDITCICLIVIIKWLIFKVFILYWWELNVWIWRWSNAPITTVIIGVGWTTGGWQSNPIPYYRCVTLRRKKYITISRQGPLTFWIVLSRLSIMSFLHSMTSELYVSLSLPSHRIVTLWEMVTPTFCNLS